MFTLPQKLLIAVIALTILVPGVLLSQVKIKEKIEIKPKNSTLKVASTQLSITFDWSAEKSPGQRLDTLHLAVRKPNGDMIGFNYFTGAISGNYRDLITYEDEAGRQYGGKAELVDSDAPPGQYLLYAVADTSAKTIAVEYMYYAEIHAQGQPDTTLYFDPIWFLPVPGTPYKVNADMYTLMGEPGAPGGPVRFQFYDIADLQHGQTGYVQAQIVDENGQTVNPPPEQYFRFEFVGDSTWGRLYDASTGRRSGVLDSVASMLVEFDAWGKEPLAPAQVTVRISAENGSIPPGTKTFTVLPPQMRASLGKATLSYGDTTIIRLEVQNADGSWMNKPGNWWARSTIVQADTFGILYRPDSTIVATDIRDTSVVLVYYAHPETEPDSIEVLIQLMVEESFFFSTPSGGQNTQGKILQKQSNALQLKKSAGGTGKTPAKILGGGVPGGAIHYGLARLKVRKSEILLGETKYYYVKDDHNGNVSIEETTDTTGSPGVQGDVWQNNSVTILPDDPKSGKKLGVYWEKKKPSGGDLPTGTIRLVGRYWHADSIYKANLTATCSGMPSRTIVVKKPARLGESDKKAIDASGAEYDLDDLIIEHAGSEGILPQYIKAIIRKEAPLFCPSYRYEPFDDVQIVQDTESSFRSYRYWIKGPADLGDPAIPTHSNIRDALGALSGYPGYKTVWDFYNEKNEQGNMYRGGSYPFLEEKWEEYYRPEETIQIDNGKSPSEARSIASDSAYARRDRWLKYDYGEGGMISKVAQTRIAASYGLMQLTYYYGVHAFSFAGYNYPADDASYRPEEINVNEKGFKYQVLHFKGKLRIALGATQFVDSTWPTVGLERAYENGLRRYNKKQDYRQAVIGFVGDYLPKAN